MTLSETARLDLRRRFVEVYGFGATLDALRLVALDVARDHDARDDPHGADAWRDAAALVSSVETLPGEGRGQFDCATGPRVRWCAPCEEGGI
jgi:hypothetical protein